MTAFGMTTPSHQRARRATVHQARCGRAAVLADYMRQHGPIASVSSGESQTPAADVEQERTVGLLLLGKGAVFAHRFDVRSLLRWTTSKSGGGDCCSETKPAVCRCLIEAPLAIELDEDQ
jgi:hypothetical protein